MVLALGWLAGCRSQPQPAGAPLASASLRGWNILLVTVDTLRRDRLGAYNGPAGLTPTFDGLAASGVRYTRAFSHVPTTLPAHASIMTGQIPPRHGVRNNGTYRLGDASPTLATVLKTAGYRTGAFVGAFVLDARYGLSRGFDTYDDRYPSSGEATSFRFAERRAADVLQAAGDWILSSEAGSPWLAWVHLFDPHAPYDAPTEYRAGRTAYDAEVAYTDAMLGLLLDRLRARRVLDRTLIVLTADHGESLGDHGESTHGLFAYSATLAVPLILSGAGLRGDVADAVAGHADIVPTVCDLLGVPAPAGMDGLSLVGPIDAERPVYFEALDANLTRGWAPLTGVAVSDWKFIDLPEPELYHLAADPAEATNLARREPARVSALSQSTRRLAAVALESAAHPLPAATDSEAVRRLRSLGYVAASRTPAANAGTAGVYGSADDPKNLVALNERFNTALAAFNDGHAEAALTGFRLVLAERPDFVTARTSAATVLLASGRAPEAVAILRDAPKHQAGSPDLQAKLGIALREAGDLDVAAVQLEGARAAGDQNPELANDLGVVYSRLGRTADARALFHELLARDPNDASAWNNLGVLELTNRRSTEAASAFRRAVDADPGRGDAWQGLGAALVESDRAAAIDAWRRAERLQPRDYDLLFNLGVVLAESPTPREALPYLERFLREAPRDRYARDVAQVEALIRKVRG
jgi:arylsulfatase A-like enzyme/tetratricopeptide (TPR) repeat protein